MNVNGLISMVTRMVLRHLVQGGINGVVNKMGQRHEKRNKAAGKLRTHGRLKTKNAPIKR